MKRVRIVAQTAAALALALCAQARAQVLEQVPENAVAVFKVKQLDTVSAKAAKMAKAFGLDQLSNEVTDPLASLQTKAHISKGLNKSGDMAIAFFAPAKGAHEKEPQLIVLVPTDDYKAFVGNFQDAKETGSITEAKAPEGDGEGDKPVFLAHWGAYAAVSPKRALLEKAPTGGLKLQGAAAGESQTKDAIFYANMEAIRAEALPQLKQNRQKIVDEMLKSQGGQPNAEQFQAVFKLVDNMVLDAAERYLEDATSSVVSLNLGEDGISAAGLTDFKPGSKAGQIVADLKGSSQPALAGLPDRKYFFFGGAEFGRKVNEQLVSSIIEPISKELAETDSTGKALAGVLDSMKGIILATRTSSAGVVVPTAALGTESLFTSVRVVNGDAQQIRKSVNETVAKASALVKLANPGGADGGAAKGNSASFDLKPDAKTLGGVSLDQLTVNLQFDPNDPRGAQTQQMMSMMYGPNGLGGLMGAVNEKSYIAVSGGNDQLVADTIASAKAGKDVLGTRKNVAVVTAQLPKQRFAEGYFALDQLVSTAARYAQQFGMPVKVRLPDDLPPIGMAAAADGSTLRVEGFIPSQLVQSLISAGLEAYQNAQNNRPGGPGGL